ncbi:tigger transposable element-derived protein 1-like [Macrobrachium rosenbergii]|uniref:tigger transposable element-derived protein 1-like n=1 Tax=Macrobrachium rosenbergii TaxID=79674 RepID=UPI0034D4756A
MKHLLQVMEGFIASKMSQLASCVHKWKSTDTEKYHKNFLPIIWTPNKKAWVTLVVFEDWFFHHFIPNVKLHCRENNISFKILLILGNAPGHPPHLDDFHPDVQIVYLPPNTTSLIQAMDQGIIANFKKCCTCRMYRQALKEINDANVTLHNFWKCYNIYNCVKNIDTAWREVSDINMSGIGKALRPHFINDFRGFNQDEEEKGILTSLADMSEKLQLDLREEDFQELFGSQSE